MKICVGLLICWNSLSGNDPRCAAARVVVGKMVAGTLAADSSAAEFPASAVASVSPVAEAVWDVVGRDGVAGGRVVKGLGVAAERSQGLPCMTRFFWRLMKYCGSSLGGRP